MVTCLRGIGRSARGAVPWDVAARLVAVRGRRRRFVRRVVGRPPPVSRAIIFSALTTATAFGSLWLSSHPGTSSMGKLLALSLLCTMAFAVLFQPALMGPPRERKEARAKADQS